MKEKIRNLKKIDKYKDTFLASITHDLRTPLYAVQSMINFSEKEENIIER